MKKTDGKNRVNGRFQKQNNNKIKYNFCQKCGESETIIQDRPGKKKNPQTFQNRHTNCFKQCLNCDEKFTDIAKFNFHLQE